MLNVITSIFLQAADDVAETNPYVWKDALQRTREKEQTHRRILEKIFSEADADGSNSLTEKELIDFLGKQESAEEFDALQLDSRAATKIFSLICDTPDPGNGSERETGDVPTVTKAQFADKINAVRGDAKALDVAVLMKQTDELTKRMVHEFAQMRKVYEHGKKARKGVLPLHPISADEQFSVGEVCAEEDSSARASPLGASAASDFAESLAIDVPFVRPKLYHIRKGGRQMKTKEVELSQASLEQDDAFVLDGGAKVYVWSGRDSSPFEQQHANLLAEKIELKRGNHKSNATLDIDEQFWNLLGCNTVSMPTTPGGLSTILDDSLQSHA